MKNKKLVKTWKKLKGKEAKQLFQEYVLFCCYASAEDFGNYLNVKEISRSDFLCLLEFMFKHDCYSMLYRLLRDNRERLADPYIESVEEVELRNGFKERLQTLLLLK